MVVSCSGQPALTPHPEPSVLTTLGCCAEEKCVTCVRYLESHTAAIFAYYLCILFIHELILHRFIETNKEAYFYAQFKPFFKAVSLTCPRIQGYRQFLVF